LMRPDETAPTRAPRVCTNRAMQCAITITIPPANTIPSAVDVFRVCVRHSQTCGNARGSASFRRRRPRGPREGTTAYLRPVPPASPRKRQGFAAARDHCRNCDLRGHELRLRLRHRRRPPRVFWPLFCSRIGSALVDRHLLLRCGCQDKYGYLPNISMHTLIHWPLHREHISVGMRRRGLPQRSMLVTLPGTKPRSAPFYCKRSSRVGCPPHRGSARVHHARSRISPGSVCIRCNGFHESWDSSPRTCDLTDFVDEHGSVQRGSSVCAMCGHGGCTFMWANEGLAQECGRRALDMRPPTYTGRPRRRACSRARGSGR
jgi:hypothetical protein